jgi:WD40 repeat protein
LCFIPLTTGEFIASGSDDGRWFIWEKRTGRLIKMLAGDVAGNYISISFAFISLTMVLMCFVFSLVVNCILLQQVESIIQ